MRWAPWLLLLAVSGCAAKNTFEVDDPHGLVRRATLRLCGYETPLERHGDTLTLTRSITCGEGDGEVLLIYKDGGPEHCIVGYVTSDAVQDWHFIAKQSSCELQS